MLKLNFIKLLKIFKSLFFLFSFITIAIFFSLNIMCYVEPSISINNWTLNVGSYYSEHILNNYEILNFNLKPSFIVFYSIGIIFFLIDIILFLFIKFNKFFNFNYSSLQLWSIILLLIIFIYFILTTCVVFIKPFVPINLNVNYSNKLNSIYYFIVENKIINFEISSSGIACIFFFCLETIILFLIIIYFSYKIIKKKYI